MPHLETLKLSKINSSKLWDDKLPNHSCIQNLRSLTIDKCGSIAVVFSSSVARELVNLQYLKISNCHMLEEIFVLGEKLDNLPSSQKPVTNEEVSIVSNFVTMVWFPRLDVLLVHLTEKDLSTFLIVGYISKLGDIGNLPHGSPEVSMAQPTSSKFFLQTEEVGN